jgi:glycopeptide antibiotics resistance protein
MFLNYQKKKHLILKCLVAGAVLSFCIEFTQLFIAERDTALHDLLNNALGSWIGAVGAAIYSSKISSIARRIFYDLFNNKPFALIIAIIAIAQSVSAITPFTVTIDFYGIKRSLKTINFIPFDYQSVGKLFLHAPNNNDLLPFDFTLFVEDFLFWMAVGFIVMLCYQLYWKNFKKIKVLLIIAPLVYFSILEFMQVFIVSRTTDINDVLSGFGGMMAGYLVFYIVHIHLKKPIAKESINILKTPLIIYAIFILFAGLRPFDWTLSPEVIARDLTVLNLIPFYSYFRTHSLWSIFDLINSILYFMPISLLWTYKLRNKGIHFLFIYLLTTSLGLAIGLGIEISQVFSPTRIAEITDVLSYGLGGALGTFLIYYFEREIMPILSLNRKN